MVDHVITEDTPSSPDNSMSDDAEYVDLVDDDDQYGSSVLHDRVRFIDSVLHSIRQMGFLLSPQTEVIEGVRETRRNSV